MSTELAPLNITDLVTYLNKGKELASISKLQAPLYLQDFIKGLDLAAEILANAVLADIRAKAKLEMVESIAYLDKASVYLTSRNMKDTSEARKMYIAIDPDVRAAVDQKAQTEAMVALLKNKLSTIKTSHDDLKKIHYGDQSMTNYENN